MTILLVIVKYHCHPAKICLTLRQKHIAITSSMILMETDMKKNNFINCKNFKTLKLNYIAFYITLLKY